MSLWSICHFSWTSLPGVNPHRCGSTYTPIKSALFQDKLSSLSLASCIKRHFPMAGPQPRGISSQTPSSLHCLDYEMPPSPQPAQPQLLPRSNRPGAASMERSHLWQGVQTRPKNYISLSLQPHPRPRVPHFPLWFWKPASTLN